MAASCSSTESLAALVAAGADINRLKGVVSSLNYSQLLYDKYDNNNNGYQIISYCYLIYLYLV